jgi:4-hydroxy-tetrahydrodipicolinate synthase
MASDRIFGLSAALVTPFAEDGSVDTARLVLHAKTVLAGGCDSFTLFGTTGEGYVLSLGDREAILAAVAGSGIEMRDSVYAGVAAVSIDDAVAQSRLALDAGARGLLVSSSGPAKRRAALSSTISPARRRCRSRSLWSRA